MGVVMIDLDDIQRVAMPVDKVCVVGIYFLLQDGEIVYVGQSKSSVHERIAHHKSKGEKKFDSVCIMEFPEEETNDWEAFYIMKFAPMYNKGLPQNKYWKRTQEVKRQTGLDGREIYRVAGKHHIEKVKGEYWPWQELREAIEEDAIPF